MRTLARPILRRPNIVQRRRLNVHARSQINPVLVREQHLVPFISEDDRQRQLGRVYMCVWRAAAAVVFLLSKR